jgi:hypothetical protein
MISFIASLGMGLLNFGQMVKKWASKLSPTTLIIAAMAVLSLTLWVRGNHAIKRRDVAVASEKAAWKALDDTKVAYKAAATRAEATQTANLIRVKQEQEQINERNEKILAGMRVDASTRYDRLRAKAQADSRRADEAGLSAAREAACQSVAGADCEAIPTLLKAAQDNTDQLVALIGAVREQEQVDTSPIVAD